MMFFDIVVWLAVAKVVVLLLEDVAYKVVRGKPSPRQRERAQHQAAEAAGRAVPKATGGWARTRAAAGGYLAGVVEDSTANARARRRRALARKRGARAVDGILVDIDDTDGFHADCDLCGWSSRPYRIEANALAAGREHTRTEHPEQYTQDPTPEPAQPSADASEPADDGSPPTDASPAAESKTQPAEAESQPGTGRPKLTVIPGGAADPQPAAPAATPGEQPPAVKPQDPAPAVKPQAPSAEDDDAPVPGPLSAEEKARLNAELFARCGHPSPKNANGMCNAPTALNSYFCLYHEQVRDASQAPTGASPDAPADLAGKTPANHEGAGIPVGATTSKENTVNLDATGPEEIRNAFATGVEVAGEKSEELAGLAGVLTDAAERFDAMKMAGSTVEQLREAAESMQAAKAAMDTAGEQLQAALADFNSKDGAVADTVADTGGNVASEDVLVGG